MSSQEALAQADWHHTQGHYEQAISVGLSALVLAREQAAPDGRAAAADRLRYDLARYLDLNMAALSQGHTLPAGTAVVIVSDCRDETVADATGQVGIMEGWFPLVVAGEGSFPNPRMRLPDGSKIWGRECWFKPRDDVTSLAAERAALTASLDRQRQQIELHIWLLEQLKALDLAQQIGALQPDEYETRSRGYIGEFLRRWDELPASPSIPLPDYALALERATQAYHAAEVLGDAALQARAGEQIAALKDEPAATAPGTVRHCYHCGRFTTTNPCGNCGEATFPVQLTTLTRYARTLGLLSRRDLEHALAHGRAAVLPPTALFDRELAEAEYELGIWNDSNLQTNNGAVSNLLHLVRPAVRDHEGLLRLDTAVLQRDIFQHYYPKGGGLLDLAADVEKAAQMQFRRVPASAVPALTQFLSRLAVTLRRAAHRQRGIPEVDSRVAGRTVVVDFPCAGATLTHDIPTEATEAVVDLALKLPQAKSVGGMLTAGCWAITFEDSPLSDQELVAQCTALLSRHVRPVRRGGPRRGPLQGRVAARTVVVCAPSDPQRHVATHSIPGAQNDQFTDAVLALPHLKALEGPLINGVYALTFEDSPLPDADLVQMGAEVVERFLRSNSAAEEEAPFADEGPETAP